MTRGVPETPGEESCDNDHDANTRGWRYCRSEEHGSFSWRAHDVLMAYYSSSAGLASYENNTLDEHGVFIGMFRAGNAGDERDLNAYLTLSSGVVRNPNGLSVWADTYLNNPVSGIVRQGDYIVIDPPGERIPRAFHGFLIIGWGEIVNCSTAMATQYSVEDFAKTREDMTVPYVVDFSGNSHNLRRQTPKPRPFYCSAYNDLTTVGDPNTQGQQENYFGRDHEWFFFTMPNDITIPSDRIFVSIP